MNENPENKETSALMSGINVISSDMKLVGSVVDFMNKELVFSN